MSLENPPATSPLVAPGRPIAVWVISIFVIFAAAFSLVSLALVHSRLSDESFSMSDEQRQFLESQGLLNYALAIATHLGNAVGAVLLFLLRKSSLYFFLGALLFSLSNTIYNIVVNDWMSAVGVSGLVIALVGWTVNIAIILYVWSLHRRGRLR